MRIECEVAEAFGTFLDFKAVKKHLQLLTDRFDHAMLLWQGDPLLEVLNGLGFRTLATIDHPTTEFIAMLVHTYMKDEYDVVQTVVHETDSYSATVRG